MDYSRNKINFSDILVMRKAQKLETDLYFQKSKHRSIYPGNILSQTCFQKAETIWSSNKVKDTLFLNFQ